MGRIDPARCRGSRTIVDPGRREVPRGPMDRRPDMNARLATVETADRTVDGFEDDLTDTSLDRDAAGATRFTYTSYSYGDRHPMD